MGKETIERIQTRAWQLTQAHAERGNLIPWDSALYELEQFITLKNPNETKDPPVIAQGLINDIGRGSAFMLALVFNENHTKVKALSLMEVFGESGRLELGVDRLRMRTDLRELHPAFDRFWLKQSQDSSAQTQRDVLLIEQNLENQRIEYKLVIARMNIHKRYPEKELYMDGIRKIQAELNGIPSSGKSVKNAV